MIVSIREAILKRENEILAARLDECESALISMVQQFFYKPEEEDFYQHSFMSAEEEAAEYLVKFGIARWSCTGKSTIMFLDSKGDTE